MKKREEKLDYHKLNEVLNLGNNILKILLIAIIIVGIYVILMVLKELKVIDLILSILSILSPLFIGITIAWLINPLVNYLDKKGIRRGLGITLSYIVLIVLLLLIIISIIPIIYDQLIDLTNSIPTITESMHNTINSIVDKFNGVDVIDTEVLKNRLFKIVSNYGNNITNSLPNMLVTRTLGLISGIGNFLIGLIIGFFMLLSFNNITDTFLIFIPDRYHENTKELINRINKSLRGYVMGALFDATIIFIACSIVFALIGLKAPILFALFCAIMNVIPYAGPYIGAVPALIVGFSQSTGIGIGVGISIIVIQSLEGNILSPIVMSKTTKLHPVTIIVGLLIFGHLFGMIGMLLSTPIISVGKTIIEFIDSKYHVFRGSEEHEKS